MIFLPLDCAAAIQAAGAIYPEHAPGKRRATCCGVASPTGLARALRPVSGRGAWTSPRS